MAVYLTTPQNLLIVQTVKEIDAAGLRPLLESVLKFEVKESTLLERIYRLWSQRALNDVRSPVAGVPRRTGRLRRSISVIRVNKRMIVQSRVMYAKYQAVKPLRKYFETRGRKMLRDVIAEVLTERLEREQERDKKWLEGAGPEEAAAYKAKDKAKWRELRKKRLRKEWAALTPSEKQQRREDKALKQAAAREAIEKQVQMLDAEGEAEISRLQAEFRERHNRKLWDAPRYRREGFASLRERTQTRRLMQLTGQSAQALIGERTVGEAQLVATAQALKLIPKELELPQFPGGIVPLGPSIPATATPEQKTAIQDLFVAKFGKMPPSAQKKLSQLSPSDAQAMIENFEYFSKTGAQTFIKDPKFTKKVLDKMESKPQWKSPSEIKPPTQAPDPTPPPSPPPPSVQSKNPPTVAQLVASGTFTGFQLLDAAEAELPPTATALEIATKMEEAVYAGSTGALNTVYQIKLSSALLEVKNSYPPDQAKELTDALNAQASAAVMNNGQHVPLSQAQAFIAAQQATPPAPKQASTTPSQPAPPQANAPLNTENWTQTGPQKGSNPGGEYTDPDGTKWYVKWPASKERAQNEQLTAKFYEMLGINAPNIQTATNAKGQFGIASQIIDGLSKKAATTLWKANGARDGFVADAWLANWDVVGQTNDNLLVKNGEAYRVDTGGGLLYRAQGAAKGDAFGNTVGEIDSLRDPKTNPQAAKIFKHVTKAQLTDGAEAVAAITDKQIRDLVFEYGPGTDSDKAALADKMIARRDDIAAKLLSPTAKPKPKPKTVTKPPPPPPPTPVPAPPTQVPPSPIQTPPQHDTHDVIDMLNASYPDTSDIIDAAQAVGNYNLPPIEVALIIEQAAIQSGTTDAQTQASLAISSLASKQGVGYKAVADALTEKILQSSGGASVTLASVVAQQSQTAPTPASAPPQPQPGPAIDYPSEITAKYTAKFGKMPPSAQKKLADLPASSAQAMVENFEYFSKTGAQKFIKDPKFQTNVLAKMEKQQQWVSPSTMVVGTSAPPSSTTAPAPPTPQPPPQPTTPPSAPPTTSPPTPASSADLFTPPPHAIVLSVAKDSPHYYKSKFIIMASKKIGMKPLAFKKNLGPKLNMIPDSLLESILDNDDLVSFDPIAQLVDSTAENILKTLDNLALDVEPGYIPFSPSEFAEALSNAKKIDSHLAATAAPQAAPQPSAPAPSTPKKVAKASGKGTKLSPLLKKGEGLPSISNAAEPFPTSGPTGPSTIKSDMVDRYGQKLDPRDPANRAELIRQLKDIKFDDGSIGAQIREDILANGTVDWSNDTIFNRFKALLASGQDKAAQLRHNKKKGLMVGSTKGSNQVKHYTGSGYVDMGNKYRGYLDTPFTPTERSAHNAIIKNGAVLDDDNRGTKYRGMSWNSMTNPIGVEFWEQMTEGNTYTLPQPTSFSDAASTANSFGGGGYAFNRSRSVMLELIPIGDVRGIPVQIQYREQETIILRGTRIKVLEVLENTEKNHKHVIGVLIPEDMDIS